MSSLLLLLVLLLLLLLLLSLLLNKMPGVSPRAVSARPLFVLTSCLFMGSTRSGSYFAGVKSPKTLATRQEFDPKDVSLWALRWNNVRSPASAHFPSSPANKYIRSLWSRALRFVNSYYAEWSHRVWHLRVLSIARSLPTNSYITSLPHHIFRTQITTQPPLQSPLYDIFWGLHKAGLYVPPQKICHTGAIIVGWVGEFW